MAESSVPSTMDFCTFVRELNQVPQRDFGGNSTRNRCPAESRLSQEFENKMQQLLSNYDLDNQNDTPMVAIPTIHCEPDSSKLDQSMNDSAFSVDDTKHDESLETTLDNEDDPLELTGDDDSEDAGDGASSDEQQQSRSLSLSYSLSISHAQENFSQYSQSTDKGLSKRYDSPCSYEDDRESECTNFDKLDDWNDFIADMQNNNNADTASRDFREYYDEYIMTKGLKGSDDGDEPTDECNTTEKLNMSLEANGMDISANTLKEEKGNHLTAVASADTSQVMEKSSFLEYRNPSSEIDDDPMYSKDNTCATMGEPIKKVHSMKRKFRYDDADDLDYEITNVITEKFQKTDVVPCHGCHEPISLIDDELFARLVRIESSNKTPVPEDNVHLTDKKVLQYDAAADYSGGQCESTVATTPTNGKNLEQLFQSFEEPQHGSASVIDKNQRLQRKVLSRQRANKSDSSVFIHFNLSD